ncbi:hypothetical protein D3C76_1722640 [compost metagenome]
MPGRMKPDIVGHLMDGLRQLDAVAAPVRLLHPVLPEKMDHQLLQHQPGLHLGPEGFLHQKQPHIAG